MSLFVKHCKRKSWGLGPYGSVERPGSRPISKAEKTDALRSTLDALCLPSLFRHPIRLVGDAFAKYGIQVHHAHEHFAGAGAVSGAYYAPLFHHVEKARGALKADAELALQHRCGSLPALDDPPHRLLPEGISL